MGFLLAPHGCTRVPHQERTCQQAVDGTCTRKLVFTRFRAVQTSSREISCSLRSTDAHVLQVLAQLIGQGRMACILPINRNGNMHSDAAGRKQHDSSQPRCSLHAHTWPPAAAGALEFIDLQISCSKLSLKPFQGPIFARSTSSWTSQCVHKQF